MTVDHRLAYVDALGVLVVWAALFVAFAQWESRVAALGSLSVGAFLVVVVFWRVRRAYRDGVVTIRTAIAEGLTWGAVLAVVMQLVLWAAWLSEGHQSAADLAASGALSTLCRDAMLSAGVGALVAIVLWTGNRLASRRPGRLRNRSATR